MNHLVYLCYGEGPWIAEIEFSILSAIRWINEAELRDLCLIVTDVPRCFEHFPVTVEPIEAEVMTQWAGPRGFNHRRKIPAMRHVLAKFGGSAVLLDGDTYFTSNPLLLFDRLGPGRSIMHMFEGRLGVVQGEMHRKLADLFSQGPFEVYSGHEIAIPRGAEMWNAGVVGMNAADIAILDDVLALADAVYERLRIHTAEQFAFSHYLGHRTKRSACDDVVFHYWLPYLHESFRSEASALLARHRDLPLEQRAAQLHPHRPRPRGIKKVKLMAKPFLQAAGLLKDRLRAQG